MAELTDLLAVAVCCREWPVSPLGRMGSCGYCGEVPVIDPTRTIDGYMARRKEARNA